MAMIGYGLHRENKRRDALPEMEEEESYIDEVQADGTVISKKLDMAFADLTDKQNLSESSPELIIARRVRPFRAKRTFTDSLSSSFLSFLTSEFRYCL